MRFVVVDNAAELQLMLGEVPLKVHYPDQDGDRPICGCQAEGTMVAIRRHGRVTCDLCATILRSAGLWRRRGITFRANRAGHAAA